MVPGEPLASRIGKEIRERGPMPFVRFMQLALFDPAQGYYMRPERRVGRQGDFLTSPAASAVFGRTLGNLAGSVWRLLGMPRPFRIVDAGAGEGGLLSALVEGLGQGPLAGQLEAVLVERGPGLRARAAERMRQRGCEPRLLAESSALRGLAPAASLVLANELFDALPVRRLRRTRAGLQEAHVEVAEDGELSEVWLPAGDEGFAGLRTGLERCVAPGLASLVEDLAAPLERGLLLVIDYGYPARLLDHPEEGGGNALRGFEAGTLAPSVLDRPGEIDLTSHVDFSALAAAGRAAGLDVAFFTDQSYLLLGLGVLEDPGILSARRLIHPEDMGGAFRCLGLVRGLAPEDFRNLGLRDRRALL